VARARDLVSRLRVGGRRDDAVTVAALEAITAEAAEDEEFVAALGEVSGHDRVMRLVTDPTSSAVAACAGDALQMCADRNPPGAPFPARGGLGLRPDRTVLHVGTLHAPLSLHLRHARENLGGAKKSIPNIAWHSGVALARWLARNEKVVRGADVVEIGAGLGAPGLAAAAFGASAVVLTDRDGAAVRNLRYNAGRGCAPPGSAAASGPGEADESDDARTASSTAAYRPSRMKTDAFAREELSLLTRRRRIAERCVAAALDWNDEQPLRRALRLADDGGGRRDANDGVDGDANDGGFSRASSRLFRLVLGADVVHERGMGDGVVRCLEELMCPERGVAVLCNPAPAHRAGAAEFLETLRRSSFEFSRVDVTSALLRVGMEEETEDITLQMFAVKKRGSQGVLPDLRDAGDAWPEFCDY
jgi:predicted nicotinamide N-methyase